MDHQDHVRLLSAGVPTSGGVWADFGAGAGAFTLALVDILGPQATVHSIDKNERALQQQRRKMRRRFPRAHVQYHHKDYTRELPLPLLDGLVIANSLHYHRRKERLIRLLSGYLRYGGRFIIVEYNTDSGNRWVPYPVSFASWLALAEESDLSGTRLLETQPSRFLGEVYSALSYYQTERE